MPLNQQTANFPPLSSAERSYALELRSFASYIAPGPGMRSGLKLGIPLSGGQPTTGLTPTLTDGVILSGDQVIGPNAKVISAAPKNVTNRRLFYGLGGFYYADSGNAAVKPTDVLMGMITTDNAATASIVSIAQQYNYGAGIYGVRGVLNLALATKGADTAFFTWAKPASYDRVRVAFSYSEILAPTTAGNTTGDDLLLKVGSTTLTTIAATNLQTLGSNAIGSPAASHVFGSATTSLTFNYNLTDTSTAIAGGLAEFWVELRCF